MDSIKLFIVFVWRYDSSMESDLPFILTISDSKDTADSIALKEGGWVEEKELNGDY